MPTTPEHIAHALWLKREQFKFLHNGDFKDEVSLFKAVKQDLAGRMYQTLEGAIAFYTDLNQHGVE